MKERKTIKISFQFAVGCIALDDNVTARFLGATYLAFLSSYSPLHLKAENAARTIK